MKNAQLDLLKSTLEEADVEPIMIVDGRKIYSLEDGRKINTVNKTMEKLNGKSVSLEERPVTGGGTGYGRSNKKVVQVNEHLFFMNRFRKVTNKVATKVKDKNGKTNTINKNVTTYEFCTDYRAIKEQRTGDIYTTHVPVYVIGKQDDELVLLEQKTVKADEFVNEFTEEAAPSVMLDIAKTISTMKDEVTDKATKLEF